MEENWKQNFKANFSETAIQRKSTLMLATGVNIIYLTLIGLTGLA